MRKEEMHQLQNGFHVREIQEEFGKGRSLEETDTYEQREHEASRRERASRR